MTTHQKIEILAKEYGVNAIYAKTLFYSLSDKENYREEVKGKIKQKPKPFVKWVGGKKTAPQTIS